MNEILAACETSDARLDRPEVSVVIVTYNSSHVISRCLQMLLESAESLEIIVYDNSSSDNTCAVVDKFSDVTLVRGDSNLGFAKSVNLAAQRAKGRYICLVNPDVQITPSSIRKLATVASRRGIGVVAPNIVHPSGRLRVRECGRFPSITSVVFHYSGISVFSRFHPFFRGMYLTGEFGSDVTEVDWVSGAVLLTSAENWNAREGLSERWFMYAEDVEFCYRVAMSGASNVVCKDVPAVHDLGGSSSGPPSANPAWVLNLYDFYKTSMSKGRLGRLGWKYAMAGGLISRCLLYAARASRSSAANVWRDESSRFGVFARAILTSSSDVSAKGPAEFRSKA